MPLTPVDLAKRYGYPTVVHMLVMMMIIIIAFTHSKLFISLKKPFLSIANRTVRKSHLKRPIRTLPGGSAERAPRHTEENTAQEKFERRERR